MRKKLLALALTACMALTMLPAALAADFSDVAEDAWYKESVDAAVEAGLMKGTGEGVFNPQGTVTRAEVVQVLYNLAGTPEAGETSFADAAGRWYAPALAWAEEAGIVDAGEAFRGGEGAARGEIADMLYRYAIFAHLPGGASHDAVSAAPDAADISEEALAGMSWCVDTGIIGGDEEGNLKPNDSATRAEFAKLLGAFTALKVVPMAEYLEAHKDEFFLTGKTEYTVQARMVSEETHIHNDLEDVDYTVTDDGESVVLTGTVGEEWVTKLEKVIKTYTKADGSAVTAEDFAQRDTSVELKTKAEPDTNYACYVPAGVAVQVDTAWGDVLYTNRAGVPHGAGDYLICAKTEDGQPNLEDVWVVNGLQFITNYDTANGPATGTVAEVEKYGHVLLDITIEDFMAAGYELGDTVNVVFDNGFTVENIPFFDGYYGETGEYLVRAYPGHTNIAVCINYGKLNEVAGVGVGSAVALSLAEKGGQKTLQELSSLVYTTERDDYASDEVFANFRMISLGGIAEGRLYRSASPVSSEYNRGPYANRLIEAAGVAAVLNLADTDEEIEAFFTEEGFDSEYYKGLYEAGKVKALAMPVDFASDSFAETLAGGLAWLSEQEGPYDIHCTEGKDRAGFTSALLECLMGASAEEVIADYMISYDNYYGVSKESDSEKYDAIVAKNIEKMLQTIAGLEAGASLEGVDLQAAAETYLTSHGMTAEQVGALQTNLGA